MQPPIDVSAQDLGGGKESPSSVCVLLLQKTEMKLYC